MKAMKELFCKLYGQFGIVLFLVLGFSFFQSFLFWALGFIVYFALTPVGPLGTPAQQEAKRRSNLDPESLEYLVRYQPRA